MPLQSLLVMVPTRNRREQAARLLKSFEDSEPSDETVLMFITDADDDSYEDMDWGSSLHAVLSGERMPLTAIFNEVALAHADDFDAIMTVGDDHLFSTPKWDAALLSAIDGLGGSGWSYPDDKRRSGFPEIWAVSSDIVKSLGWFALPAVKHFYCDNAVHEIGMRTSLIRYCPDVVIEHLHYSVAQDTARDDTYAEAENSSGTHDMAAYKAWRDTYLANTVSKIRREFNPDVKWILGKV